MWSLHKTPISRELKEARPGDILNNKFCDFTYLLELSACDLKA